MIYRENTTVIAEYEQKWIEGLNRGDVSVADEAFHPDCIIHINGSAQKKSFFKTILSKWLVGFN
ncbi:MAG: hypothetical protein ABIU11_05755 [Chitinophagaceae bacterium]